MQVYKRREKKPFYKYYFGISDALSWASIHSRRPWRDNHKYATPCSPTLRVFLDRLEAKVQRVYMTAMGGGVTNGLSRRPMGWLVVKGLNKTEGSFVLN